MDGVAAYTTPYYYQEASWNERAAQPAQVPVSHCNQQNGVEKLERERRHASNDYSLFGGINYII